MEGIKPKAVIFDIDDTLSDTGHRQPLAVAKQWSAFYDELPNDEPMRTIEILEALREQGICIILLTGRPDKYRIPTMKWLNKHGVKYAALLMRPADKPYVKDAEIKLKHYTDYIQPNYDVIAVFDDRKQCVDMWRKIGLLCFQPKESNF